MGYGREERIENDGKRRTYITGKWKKGPASTKTTEPANKSAKSTLYNSKSTFNNFARKARDGVKG